MVDRLSYPVTGDHHLSDGWEDHIARGSLGGVDFPVPYGTPVYATHDGFLSIDNSSQGSGGRVATVQGGGITDQCLHMSSFARGNGNVSRGELVGYSGASAYGSDYGTGGPHVHWHAIVNGIRVNALNYLADGADFAGENITPISPEEDDMTPEQAKKLDELAWTVNQMKGSLDALMGAGAGNEGGKGPVHEKLDKLLWVGADGQSGLRSMVQNVLNKLK